MTKINKCKCDCEDFKDMANVMFNNGIDCNTPGCLLLCSLMKDRFPDFRLQLVGGGICCCPECGRWICVKKGLFVGDQG